jgi:transposase
MIFGIKNSEIKLKTGVSYDALRKYRNALEAENIDPLFINNGYREKSELEKFDAIIIADFDKDPPKTLREAQERIQELTGLTRSLARIRVYLQKRGLKVGL